MSWSGRFTVGSGLLLSLASACSEATPTGHLGATAPNAEIDFDPHPDYLPDNVVVLTFDDGPDWNNTARVLDVLRDKDVKAAFFINTENWSNVNTDGPMRDLVRRMVNEGHELASHSVHHQHMGSLSADAVEAELRGVEDTVNSVIGAGAPRMTLFRAPFGEPYQGNDPSWPSPAYQLVAPIVAQHAVHVGWAIDSFDYACAGSAQCVIDNVEQKLAAGDHGIMLFHSVHAQTADALPAIIDHLRDSGYEIWSVEDAVAARFGATSAQIVDGGGDGPVDPPGDDDPPDDDPPGDDPGGDGDCDWPLYAPNTQYSAGERVQNDGKAFQCKDWPYTGWCGAGEAYAPGTGWAWQDAWVHLDTCGGGETEDPGDGPEDPVDPGDPGDDDAEWHTANLTWFTSYPDPGSPECEDFNGCMWAGYFAFLDQQMSEDWVASHDIAAVHSDHADQYALKTLRIRQDDREIDVTVYDMCSDSDCDGCCTDNMSETGFLIDIESYTMERFGSGWGVVEWRCLDCD